MTKSLMIFACIPIVLLILNLILNSHHPIIKSLTSALSGITAFGLLEYFSCYCGICVPLNPTTIFISAILGIPGVAALAVLNSLFCY